MTTQQPGWHEDPCARFDHRWWDGQQWTATVSRQGQQTTDPLGVAPGHTPTSARSDAAVARQVSGQVAAAGGGGTRTAGAHGILDADVLVVNQKAKLIELSNEYMVYDENGTQVGSVRQVGQNAARKAVRFLMDVDQFLTHKLEVTDTTGATVLRITRPAKLIKSTVIVEDAAGRELGRLIQQNVFGKIRFDMQADGGVVGSLNAENWRAWDFSIQDQSGTEVARVKKTFEGLARAVFTTADNYVVRVHTPLTDPLRSLVVAAALCIDTALKQDSKG
jgi:uncharacterized protein YxjI